MYDVIVLGTGPAGLQAAIGAKGRGHSVLVIGNRWQDSPLAKAELVDNYLGMPGLTGAEMLAEMDSHARSQGVEMVEGKVVAMMAWQGYALTVGSEMYQCKALILAPGIVRQAKFAGEEGLLGRGVSYCATCVGMLYRGKSVAVIGRSKDSVHEANYLQNIGCSVIYIAPKIPQGLDETITAKQGNRIEVLGDTLVSGITVDGEEIACQGVFILRDAVAPSDLISGLQVENGTILVDREMRTNLPGVFAAGDCTGGALQVAKAVGEGHVAALSASGYLQELMQNMSKA